MTRVRNVPGDVIVGFTSLFLCIAATVANTAGADTFDVNDYRGKVVIVHFWASWSLPCRQSLPWLDAMLDKYGDQGLVVVGVNEDDDELDAEKFLQEFPVNFRIVTDTDGELFRSFDLIAMPSSYLIDRQGQIVTRYLGFKPAEAHGFEATLLKTLVPRSDNAGDSAL